MSKYRDLGDGVHWTDKSGGKGMTNFSIDKLAIYEEAIKQYGDDDLFIGKPIKPIDKNNQSYLALYCDGIKNLSDFWRVYERTTKR